MTVRGYQLAADWSRAGLFTGTLEDVSSYVTNDDIVVSWGRADIRATEDAAAGTLTFTLINIDRQFSDDNTSSPIAGDVLPGTPVRFNVTDPATGGITTVFQGPMDDLDTDPNAAGKDFTAKCSDGWGAPGDTKLSTLVYTGQRTGDLITIILDAIGWPAAKRALDPGATLVPYWWVEGVDAATAINDLVHSEGPPAIAYVQNGIFCFRDRHHRLLSTRSATSQGTYTHVIPAGTGPDSDHKIIRNSFRRNHGLKNIVNSATLEVTPRIPGNRQVVWSSDDPILLGASETVTFVIRTDDPFLDLQTPQEQVVYLEDGTWTFDYHLASGAVSFALSRTSGQSAFLTITAGAGGAFLDLGIKVRGTPLKQGATRKFTAGNPGSAGTFGANDWDGTAPWAYFYDADVLVNKIVNVYGLARPSVSFDIDGVVSAATLTEILGQQISDRITVRNDELGLNADFMVERLTHTVQQLGVRHRLRIDAEVVEPTQAANPFIFDTATPLVNGFGNGQFGMDAVNNASTMFMFDTASPTTQGFGAGVFAA
jgi:hypothetical protein